jgi:hypothetical protein
MIKEGMKRRKVAGRPWNGKKLNTVDVGSVKCIVWRRSNTVYTSSVIKFKIAYFLLHEGVYGIAVELHSFPTSAPRYERSILYLSSFAKWGRNIRYALTERLGRPPKTGLEFFRIAKKYIAPVGDTNPNRQIRCLVTLPRYFGNCDGWCV